MLRVAIFMSMPRRPPLKRRRGKHDGRHGAVIAPSYGGFARRIKALEPLRRSPVSPVLRRSGGATASSGVNSSSERINPSRFLSEGRSITLLESEGDSQAVAQPGLGRPGPGGDVRLQLLGELLQGRRHREASELGPALRRFGFVSD